MGNATVTGFRVGSVFARGLGILAVNAVPFGLVTIVIMSPTYLYAIFVDPTRFTARGLELTGGFMTAMLFESALGYLVASVLIHATIRHLRGGRPDIGESLRWGFRLIFPVLGIAIVGSIGVMLGFVLLIVPGLYLATIWWFVVPAAVVEKTGVIESFARSNRLTAGHRWRVLAFVVMINGSFWVVTSVIDTMFAGAGSGIVNSTAYALTYFAATAIVTMADAVLGAVAYHDLRILKEGDDAGRIAAVFD